MTKLVKADLRVTSLTVSDQQGLKISVPPECTKDWLLCLHLLAEGLTETCTFLNINERTKLSIHLGSRSRWIVEQRNAHYAMTLDPTSLDCLRAFFGRYYRDGFAEVDHVDLQPDEPLGSYITISVHEYAPPCRREISTECLVWISRRRATKRPIP